MSPLGTAGTSIPVFCLPYAGGTARAYRVWRRQFPTELEVVPLDFVPRRACETGQFSGSIREVVDDLVAQIHSRQPDSGYVLFGHSMGALAAFEIALTHSDYGLPPPALVVISGRNPPYVRSRWGTEVLDLPDRAAAGRPSHDDRIPAQCGRSQRRCSAACPSRREDPLVDPVHVAGWARYTRRQCTVHHHNGGHFALFEEGRRPDELIDDIQTILAGAVNGMAC